MKASRVGSRLLAVILLIGLCGLVFRVAMVPAWQHYYRNLAEIEESRELIERFSRIAANHNELADELRRLSDGREVSRQMLDPGSPSLAAAGLQELVKSVVEDAAGRLTSTQVLPPQPELGFLRIAINVRMAVDTTTLQAVMYQLERGAPLLIIDEVMVVTRRKSSRRSRRSRRNKNDQSPLDVRFKLSGFMTPEPSEAGRAPDRQTG